MSSPAMSRFVSVARVEDVPETRGLTVRVEGLEFALFKVAGEIIALNGRCPHRGSSLGEGTMDGGHVFCPMHGWEFELRTGACVNRPDRPAQSVPVRVRDGQIEVCVAIEPGPQ